MLDFFHINFYVLPKIHGYTSNYLLMYFRLLETTMTRSLKVKIRHLQAVKIVHFFIKIQIQKLYYSSFFTVKTPPYKNSQKGCEFFFCCILFHFEHFMDIWVFFNYFFTSRLLPNTLRIKSK